MIETDGQFPSGSSLKFCAGGSSFVFSGAVLRNINGVASGAVAWINSLTRSVGDKVSLSITRGDCPETPLTPPTVPRTVPVATTADGLTLSWTAPSNWNTETVRFRAGGTREMCWHLFTWGDGVTVEAPESLRRELAEMCAGLAGHHGGRTMLSGRRHQKIRERVMRIRFGNRHSWTNRNEVAETRESGVYIIAKNVRRGTTPDVGDPRIVYIGQTTRPLRVRWNGFDRACRGRGGHAGGTTLFHAEIQPNTDDFEGLWKFRRRSLSVSAWAPSERWKTDLSKLSQKQQLEFVEAKLLVEFVQRNKRLPKYNKTFS